MRSPQTFPHVDGTDELFGNAPIGMARVSTSGHFLAVNAMFCSMLGYTEPELLGRHFVEITLAEDRDTSLAKARFLLEAERQGPAEPLEKTYLRKDGQRLTVLLSTSVRRGPDGRALHFLTQVMDVTQERRQRDLQELSAGVLQQVASGATLSEVLTSLVTRLEILNQDWSAAIEVRAEGGERMRVVHAPSLDDELRRALDGQPIGSDSGSGAAATHTGRRIVVGDVDSHPVWRNLRETALQGGVRAAWSEPIRGRDPAVRGALTIFLESPRLPSPAETFVLETVANLAGIAFDHDEREERMRSGERQLRTTLHAIGDAVLTTDERGVVVDLNPAATALLGSPAEEALGRSLSSVLRLRVAGGVHFDERLENPPDEPWSWTGALEGAGGAHREVALQAWPIEAQGASSSLARPVRAGRPAAGGRSAAGRRPGVRAGAVIVLRDVGEERLREEQLRQSNKMEAVGQLAGGIAHDFNNLLTGILGNAELLCASGRPADRRLAEAIVEASARAAELTSQLLAFSRAGKVDDSPVDVHAILDEVTSLLARSVDPRVRIFRDYRAQRAEVRGDRSQLRNAFLHLALNARDAMPAGGELRFVTELVPIDPLHPEGPAQLHVAVQDTGTGMPEHVLERAFEPFFTTKAVGEGSGLGLAGVYGCVQSHGGEVHAESAVGQGSVLHVTLPLLELPETAEWLLTYGDGHVLVVDDEEVVRNLARTALGRLGYRVTVAEGGPEAIALLEGGGLDPDVVVLDMVMPEMDGATVFRRLRELCPDVTVLLSSGSTRDGVVEELMRAGAAGFLSKPFRIEELGVTIDLARKRTV